MSLAYHDGQYVDKAAITIRPSDFGFSRGLTVFELTRVYQGMAFRLDDHVDRFAMGARLFGIRCPVDSGELERIARHLIAQNKYPHSVVKFYLTAGECAQPGTFGFARSEGFTPHLIVMEEKMEPLHPEAPKGLELYRRGIRLKTVPFARQNPLVKSINYAPGYCAAQALAAEAWDEILYTDAKGNVTETTISNFFAVIDGVLCTPAEGMLAGVTRKVLLELADRIDLKTAEINIKPADVSQATEAFIASSFLEMVPVKAVDTKIFATTIDGRAYSQLRRAFTAYVQEALASHEKA
ncbi:MAG: aminotransferase class IV [Pseudomonadota bacterium]|nr:aminotransferase class IV [Pseudomonadota bacterium]